MDSRGDRGVNEEKPLTACDLILAEMERKRHFERDFYENVLEPHVKVLMKRLQEWNMEYLQKIDCKEL